MAYDKALARRVAARLADKPGYAEKKMFGGICYLMHGNMACGVLNADLIVRVGLESYTQCLELPHTRPFDITGRPMRGWVMVSAGGHRSDEDLAAWIDRGVGFALTLPAK